MTKPKTNPTEEENFDFMNEAMGDTGGYEDMDMNTMAIPFIRIIQALSPQLKKNKPEYIPDAEVNDLCNSITGKIYTLPLQIIIGKFERLYLEWKPNRGGFCGAHAPDQIENNPKYYINDKFKHIDKQTLHELVDTYTYYVVMPDHMEDGVCIISLSSTQLKEAKKLNRMLMNTYLPGTTKKALPHFMKWGLDVVEKSNDQGEWGSPVFNFSGFVTKPELDYVVEERAQLPGKTVDYANMLEDTTSESRDDNGEVKY